MRVGVEDMDLRCFKMILARRRCWMACPATVGPAPQQPQPHNLAALGAAPAQDRSPLGFSKL